MKAVLVLSVFLCAAFAAPAEDKQKPVVEAAVEAAKEEAVAAVLDEKKEEELFVPVLRNAASEEAAAHEGRFNICPGGWFSHGSRCFLFVNSPMSWYSAEEHCNVLGGHLASATNPTEYSFLQQITKIGSQSIAWLGGFNLQGRWMWIDRQGLYYTNWYSPSSSSSYPCMYLRSSNGWGNTQCGSSQRFICSKNAFGC